MPVASTVCQLNFILSKKYLISHNSEITKNILRSQEIILYDCPFYLSSDCWTSFLLQHLVQYSTSGLVTHPSENRGLAGTVAPEILRELVSTWYTFIKLFFFSSLFWFFFLGRRGRQNTLHTTHIFIRHAQVKFTVFS